MGETQKNIVDIDDSLRLVGTAHISSASVELVRQQIEEWGPDLVKHKWRTNSTEALLM
jgi:pheromone shutdown protein TraB